MKHDPTKAQWEGARPEEWNPSPPAGGCSAVLIPTERKHDSGYRVIEVVSEEPYGSVGPKITACSDVIHLGGIGGRGGWSIDLLPCGLFRVYPASCSHVVFGTALSSLEIFEAGKERSREGEGEAVTRYRTVTIAGRRAAVIEALRTLKGKDG